MTFKIHENDYNQAVSLYSILHDNGVEVWMRLNADDMSDCKWHVEGGLPHAGGVGALINDLKKECYEHKFLQRPRRMSRRNPVRLSSDANGKCWTVYNGG